MRVGGMCLGIAGTASALIARMHVAIILIGEPAFRYFTGLGDDLADMLVRGSIFPALLPAAIACCFAVFALYGFAGAKIIPPPPRLRTGLFLTRWIYLLRGLTHAPFYASVLLHGAVIERDNSILYDPISFGTGMLHTAGKRLEWNALSNFSFRKSFRREPSGF
jgi:hypothetical protein